MAAYQIGQILGIFFSGLLIGMLFSRFIYPRKEGGKSEKTTVIALVAAAVIGTRILLFPQLANNQQDADKALQTIPFYQTIKAQEPEAYQEVLNAIVTHTKNPEQNPATLLQQAQILLAPILLERLSQTSDQTLMAYTTDMVSVLRKLEQHDPNLCYIYLFPDSSQSIQASSESRQIIMDASTGMMETMNKVMLDSNSNRSIPTEAQVENTIIELFGHLYDRYGDDVDLLDDSEHVRTPAQKKAICAITIDLYQYLLDQNDEQSINTLRFVLSP